MIKANVSKRRALSLLLVSCVFLVAGCGKPSGTVSGHVSYQGKALDHGTVTLFPAEGPGVGGQINADGTYSVSYVPLGKAKVIVTSTDPKMAEDAQRIIKERRDNKVGATMSRPQIDPSKYNNLPSEYGDRDKTKIDVDVHAGRNDLDINLK
jgi:hypothetical protein